MGKRFQLEETLMKNPISNEKKQNVRTLLEKQYNKEEIMWQNLPELEFYKNILEDNVIEDVNGTEKSTEQEIECDCLENDQQIHI